MVSAEQKKDWPLYQVSIQHQPGGNIVVRKVKAPDVREVEELMRRMECVASCSKLSLYEVTEEVVDKATGEVCQVWHVGDPNKQWPKYNAIEKDSMIYAPKAIPTFERAELPRELPPAPEHITKATPQIVMPPVQNRTISNEATRINGQITDVRTIKARIAAKREERTAENRNPSGFTETFKPMKRLIKKVA